ncbi:MAG TPA: ABC transporter ATP-binding protein [Bacteroidia bacterium]|nr:ABC transporter ATP-binding protein [Bacteroidia bacterium]
MELIIKNLSKTYANGTKALNNINLEIPTGLFGLLGPNGAGKSSLMRTIATLQDADEGSLFLDDLDVMKNKDEMRKYLGYLPQEFGVYPSISAEDLLEHLCVLKGVVNSKERKELVKVLLNQTNLYEVRKKNVGGYSGGMKQRFGIAQALIGSPKVIIVDEPTAGLDPAERNRFLNLLSEISEQVIIIFSTHIVDDVKELCNNMAVINKGEVVAKGNPQDLINELKGKVFQKVIEKYDLELYKNSHRVISNRLSAGKTEIHVTSNEVNLSGFELISPSLEDVYFDKIV